MQNRLSRLATQTGTLVVRSTLVAVTLALAVSCGSDSSPVAAGMPVSPTPVSTPARAPAPIPTPTPPPPAPSFTGVEAGRSESSSCTADGVFAGFCGELPRQNVPMVVSLIQTGSAVTGSIDAGGLAVKVTGTANGNRLTISGRERSSTRLTGIVCSLFHTR